MEEQIHADENEEEVEEVVEEEIMEKKESPWKDAFKRRWYRFRSNPLSVLGLIIAGASIFLAIFGEYVVPYPEHGGLYSNYSDAFIEPFQSMTYVFGTDEMGRDILTRTILGFRYSLRMAAVVLTLVVPLGVVLGLTAGYHKDTWIDTLIMRTSDIFIAVPPLVFALSVTSMLEPTAFNAMMAVSLMWWPWYVRLTYNNVSSVANEEFVSASEIMGASKLHTMFIEILPNCSGAILTKLTLDIGWVILIGASLSFVGLGAQPPTPDLGTMVASGRGWLPTYWWPTLFPALAISFIILGFNLLGDGIKDAFEEGS